MIVFNFKVFLNAKNLQWTALLKNHSFFLWICKVYFSFYYKSIKLLKMLTNYYEYDSCFILGALLITSLTTLAKVFDQMEQLGLLTIIGTWSYSKLDAFTHNSIHSNCIDTPINKKNEQSMFV